MSELRWVALLAAAALFLWNVRRRSQGRTSTWDFIAWSVISLLAMSVVIAPDAYNRLFEEFNLSQEKGNRVVGLLVVAVLVLFFMTYRLSARLEATDRALTKLVRNISLHEAEDQPVRRAPVSVVIPAYNEAENILPVIHAVPESVCGLATSIIVVVDGADDDTATVAEGAGVTVVRHFINRGGGAALRCGYERALKDGADIIVTLDADGQHDPREMDRLVQPILDGEADFVNGSRVLGDYEKDGFVRPLGVVVFNGLVSVLLWRRITDVSNAYRAIRADVVRKLQLYQNQFHSSETLIGAVKAGARVKEVPITIRLRTGGVSKKGANWRYSMGFLQAMMRSWLR
jgi:hypothetical protein